jgi:hypothetical protein
VVSLLQYFQYRRCNRELVKMYIAEGRCVCYGPSMDSTTKDNIDVQYRQPLNHTMQDIALLHRHSSLPKQCKFSERRAVGTLNLTESWFLTRFLSDRFTF